MSSKYTSTGEKRGRVARSRRTNRHRGVELASGKFHTLHDLKCLALQGCDLKKLVVLLGGKVVEPVPPVEDAEQASA